MLLLDGCKTGFGFELGRFALRQVIVRFISNLLEKSLSSALSRVSLRPSAEHSLALSSYGLKPHCRAKHQLLASGDCQKSLDNQTA